MQFKREDLGLYFATALIGGGFGLLAGAFITAQVNKKREEDFRAADAARDESWYPEVSEEVMASYQGLDVPDDAPIISIDSMDVARGATVPTLEEVEKAEGKKIGSGPEPWEEKRSGPPPSEKRGKLSKEERQELIRLTEAYGGVTQIQIDLVEQGTMTLEELESALIDIEFQEQKDATEITRTDYNEPYRDSKPEMAELLGDKPLDDTGPREIDDLLVVVDGKWEILLEPPEGKGEQQKRTIYFDADDESVFQISGDGKHAVAADIRVIATPQVHEIIMPWLLFEEELETIYLNDTRNKKTRWYEIVRVSGKEELLENNAER